MAMPLALFAWASGLLDDVTPLRQFYTSNYEYHRQQGNQWGAAWAAYSLGTSFSTMYGDAPNAAELSEGRRHLERSLALFRSGGNPWASTYALHAAAEILMAQKEYERAREMYHESLQICRRVGDPGGVAFALHGLGEVASHLQEYEGSWRYLVNALQVSFEHRSEMVIWHLFELASAFAAADRPARTVELLAFISKDADSEWLRNYGADKLAELAEHLPPESFAAARRYGERVELETLVQTLAAEFSEAPAEVAPEPVAGASGQPPLVEALSERELEVLQLVAEGMSNREIAARLTVTVGTVKKHLNNIFGKLQVTSRTQAVARARAHALLR